VFAEDGVAAFHVQRFSRLRLRFRLRLRGRGAEERQVSRRRKEQYEDRA